MSCSLGPLICVLREKRERTFNIVPMTLSVQIKGHGAFLERFTPRTGQCASEASGCGSGDTVALDRKRDKVQRKKVTISCALTIPGCPPSPFLHVPRGKLQEQPPLGSRGKSENQGLMESKGSYVFI